MSRDDLGDPSPTGNPQAIIPVENIAGPILLTCGGQDDVWPSCNYTDAITARLSAHHFAYPVTALNYPDAGHLGAGGLVAYYSVTTAADAATGGTLNGNQTASADSHTKVLAYLASQ